MSNVDNFDDDIFGDDDDIFGDDDLFADDDFDLDETEEADDFLFDEDDADLDELDSFNLSDDDDLSFEEEEETGTSRTFIILAALMILFFLVGIGLVLFLALRETGPSDIEMTSTQIAMENAQTIEAATQDAIVRQTESFGTQEAINAGATETAEAEAANLLLTQTAEAEATNDQATAVAQLTANALETAIALSQTPTPLSGVSGGLDIPGTQTAQVASLTQQAISATQTFEAGQNAEVTEEVIVGPPSTQVALNVGDVAATATAIAQQLQGGVATPTPQEAIPGGETTDNNGGGTDSGVVDQGGGTLPDTGLLDDLGSDQGILLVILLAMGLLGLIAVSRTLRAANARQL
jgi:hypothetical protein